jgi:hypothetical protein
MSLQLPYDPYPCLLHSPAPSSMLFVYRPSLAFYFHTCLRHPRLPPLPPSIPASTALAPSRISFRSAPIPSPFHPLPPPFPPSVTTYPRAHPPLHPFFPPSSDCVLSSCLPLRTPARTRYYAFSGCRSEDGWGRGDGGLQSHHA